jgi:peroxin-5
VLVNTKETECIQSIEAFKNAIKLKPDDPQLWNKLGATQANSSRSQEAVHAYQR